MSTKGILILGHDVTVDAKPIPRGERTNGFRAFSFRVTRDVDPYFDLRKSGWHVLGFGYARDSYLYASRSLRQYLRGLRLRPARHARTMSGVRDRDGNEGARWTGTG
jgi:hypothetical protein